MATVTITAAEGQRLRATIQQKTRKYQGLDGNDQPVMVDGWDALNELVFASELRAVPIGPGQRILVEDITPAA